MAELSRPVAKAGKPRCGVSKTQQVNIKMSPALKKACKNKANELGISFTDLIAEGAIHMLDSHYTEKQRVSIMVQNQERLNQAFSLLSILPDSPEAVKLREVLVDIMKGEESAWQL